MSDAQHYQEAARCYWQALSICREVYEDIANFDALVLYDLASRAMQQCNLLLAKRYYQQALDVCLKRYADDDALRA